MQLLKREWRSYLKSTIIWMISLILLIAIAFYKVDGMSNVNGGMDAMMASLPPAFQTLLGVGIDYTSGVGMYGFLHMYLLIALSFHAVILSASIFSKEERDKTFEFLYVKGMRRNKILSIKIVAGLSLLLFLNILCFISVGACLLIMDKSFVFIDFLPFMIGLFMAQGFFFSLTFLLVFILPKNQKADIIGCCIVLVMFLITMYAKLGGNVDTLNNFSIFYQMDATRLENIGLKLLPSTMIIGSSILCLGFSLFRHEHRDLL